MLSTFSGPSNQSDHRLNSQPYSREISITPTPISASDTYGRDEIIQVSVNFGQNVAAGNGVYAILRTGLVWTQGHAGYTPGNGTDTLVFEYQVLENDSDNNGVEAFVPPVLDVKSTGTEIAYEPHPSGVTPTPGRGLEQRGGRTSHARRYYTPTVSSISFADNPGPIDDETHATGEWIDVWVTFSEFVLATGTPQIELNICGTAW